MNKNPDPESQNQPRLMRRMIDNTTHTETGDNQTGDNQPQSGPGEQENIAAIGQPFQARQIAAAPRSWRGNATIGRRTRQLDTTQGSVVRAAIPTEPITQFSEIALAATLRTVASRVACIQQRLPIHFVQSDLRRKVRAARIPNLILFVVDASGSMAARQRMVAVKGAILSLLIDAYQKRDKVGLITFRGQKATLVLSPTNSVEQAQRYLTQLPTGGRTPLASGLIQAQQVIEQQTRYGMESLPLLVFLSDGRANVSLERNSQQGVATMQSEVEFVASQIAQQGWSSLVVDCESGFPRLHLAVRLAQLLQGDYIRLENLSADTVTEMVRQRIDRGTVFNI